MNDEARHIADMERQYHDAVFDKFREGQARMEEMERRIRENTVLTAASRTRIDELDRGLKENTVLTHGLKDDTSELLEILRMGKSGMKVLGWLGVAAKWVATIATAGVSVWAVWQGRK